VSIHIRQPLNQHNTICGLAPTEKTHEWRITIAQARLRNKDTLCETCLYTLETYLVEEVDVSEKSIMFDSSTVSGGATQKTANTPPSRYTILQNNQGWWQILKRNKEDSYWVVEVPNCGSRRAAVLMLNALIHATVEGTPEALINRAYSKADDDAAPVQ
jgi:hypothetical protein